MAEIINGKAIAATLRADIAKDIAALKAKGTEVGLAVILVGDDPASHVYVGNKVRACEEVGIVSYEQRLPDDATETQIRHVIKNLNANPTVHGILLQLPLPAHLADVQESLVQSIAPEKDVDGLTTVNAGKLFLGLDDGLVPCTPQGSLLLIKNAVDSLSLQGEGWGEGLSGKHAVVIGRSNLFGKPMAQLLLQENCTVTTAHSKTKNLEDVCRSADILVAAVGRAKMVKGSWIKPGAIVIDVGINRMDSHEGGGKLCGDVDYAEAAEVAGAITPVPGGVGPMTIACLLKNTLKAANA